jgi:sec-independent protein translocase protein TatC
VAKVLRPIGHEDRLSIVGHLDELRSRLVVCLVAFGVAFGICFWQNVTLLHLLNRALPQQSAVTAQHGLGSLPNANAKQREADLQQAQLDLSLSASPRLSPTIRQQAAEGARSLAVAAKALPKNVQTQEKPITIGPAEALTTTLAVVAYFALLFSLPVLMFEAYGFVLPALNPNERRTALPVMVAAPLLFVIGVAFAYLFVLPPAMHFLQGYNNQEFQVLIQAKSFYTFEVMTMLGIGLAFQLPLGLLALHRIGVIDGHTLTRHWRYAIVIIAVIAAALPGPDPVTTGLETLPLVLLFLVSIVLLRIADRRAAARAAAEAAQSFDSGLEPSS